MIIYSLPMAGALIGWFTNYLAIKMLFHPRAEKKILFLKIQGIFPKRQQALAHKVGMLVSSELISTGEIIEHLKEKASSEAALDHLATRLAEAMTRKLPQGLPMLAMLVNTDLVGKIRAVLFEHLQELIRELIDTLTPTLEEDLDIQAIVEEKITAFSSDKLEEILFSIMRKEFRFIELVGAILGFIIGLGQIVLLKLA